MTNAQKIASSPLEANVHNELTRTVVLGTIRELPCLWCSTASHKPMRRQHVYGEYRSWRQVERFWECATCGHQITATEWDRDREAKVDPETELLHAQWREDNENSR